MEDNGQYAGIVRAARAWLRLFESAHALSAANIETQ